ncbi:isocitrate lyase/PEP mutase family protein [Arthrobacter sp. AOP36-A1-22]|uniref:isocitrate lyase/PEP mutase family protein n=1 Tax=Arthrobacter sp. AOP36-A1-22 TaxID=3457684 RepID=UPI00403344E4
MTPPGPAARFLALHHGPTPLLLPNAWDTGSARLFASMGFLALATTSSGYAASRGRLDGGLTREETLKNAAELVQATELPVSADLENGFADQAAAVGRTYDLALQTGLAGASIEDSTGDPDSPIHGIEAATERVAAAAEACHRGPAPMVLTGRAENFLHGRPDLADTIHRLQAYQEAGADVLYAPGLTRLEDIRSVVESVDRPLNVLATAGTPPVSALSRVGVGRVSVGGAFAFAALEATAAAAREFLDEGTSGYTSQSKTGKDLASRIFPA